MNLGCGVFDLEKANSTRRWHGQSQTIIPFLPSTRSHSPLTDAFHTISLSHTRNTNVRRNSQACRTKFLFFAKNESFNQLALFFHSRLPFPFFWFCDFLSISFLALLHSIFRVRIKSKKNDQENTWISRIWRFRLTYVDFLYVGCRAADDSSAWPRGSAIVDRTTIHCTIAQLLLCSPKAWTREGNAFCLNVHEASYEV